MIRWGVLGLGNIAKRFCASLAQSETGVLYAVASRSEEKCEAYRAQYGCVSYTSYEELLRDEQVDAVYIALPHGLHKTWSIAAMSHHKAVLCEKPCTLNLQEMEEIAEVAEKENVFFMEAMKGRFNSCIDLLKKDLDAGVIGTLTHVYADFCSDTDQLGRMCYLYEKEQGGVLLDVGPYPVSFFTDLLPDTPRVLSARKIVDQNGVEHHLEATLLFENGVRADLAVGSDGERPRQAILTGTKGRIVVPYYYRCESYSIETEDGKSYTRSMPMPVDDMHGEIEEVHACLREGRTQSLRFPLSASLRQMSVLDEIKGMAQVVGTITYPMVKFM